MSNLLSINFKVIPLTDFYFSMESSQQTSAFTSILPSMKNVDELKEYIQKAVLNRTEVKFQYNDDLYTFGPEITKYEQVWGDPNKAEIETNLLVKLILLWESEYAKFKKLESEGNPQDYIWDPSVLKEFGLA